MAEIPIHTSSFKGIGKITVREIEAKFGSAATDFETHRVADWDITRFRFTGAPEALIKLGTVEDVFYSLAMQPLEGSKEDLEKLRAVIRPEWVNEGLSPFWTCSPRRRVKSRLTYRVVVQARDAAWRNYRRGDVQRAVARAIKDGFPKWRRVEEDADVEFWAQLVGKNALVGLRLSDASMRHRTYKSVNIPGSLRPTIARAAVLLAEVADGDAFLDPMCGAGTILIERALAGRHRLLLGGDIDSTAVGGTIENFGGRHKPWRIALWDAGYLPLAAGSIDKVVCNLPWDRRFPTGPAGIKKLYRYVLREVSRAMKPGARGVFLTKRTDVFREALPKELKIAHQTEPIAVLGQQARLSVVQKQGG